jgi:molybdopterin converting factor subunit 1
MRFVVKLFATLRDRAQAREVTVELDDGATVAMLRKKLAADYPALVPSLPTCVAAVNQEFAFDDTPLHAGDQVALFPPVSGGMDAPTSASSVEPILPTITRITPDAVDVDQIVQSLTLPTTGAVVTFTGVVRGSERDRRVVQLFYEAYTPMAEAKLRQVADEMRARFPDVEGIALIQRVGTLAAGEPTVLVAVSSPHRDQGCFEAARYGIDRIKEIAPVWKKEIGPNGEVWIEGHYTPQPGDRAHPSGYEIV